MTFGENLKKVRQLHGDSLRKLAEKTDVVFTYIDKIEKGVSPISKNMFEKIIKVYPLQEQTLTKAYLEEVLPERILKNIGLKIEDDFLSNMKNLIKMLDKENQKLAFLYIIERLEFTSMKNGTYDKIKKLLEEVKEKINKT
ncbi:hypothetical protein A2U10_01130 [Fusobacterium necrophorum subsp. funduliforme]|uniref:HTH cro/C1-type domain-containing protein n=1 Tax=Fusobacterium necrophorum subsp. funduliforme TaxID=143387 RepID=A0A162IQE8_9FUSO|nr:helix-turn-helix transcriptional regulator [Fusobacterium necrophorum]KYL03822.1 hypothetical protein A2J07_11050 [Fusobacterium necrophorum subsp. funduliforme]KYM40953.1 hypothetical protein A2U10_01130 [Fusobacterium necrophorum subsp. funduliforme]KYM44555.1 hypothetical protein A2U08_02485 [Fusobacterium necrophorum subsp. funduliforme]KYM47212.1 hypothetical protein A2U04_08340 [Fusobacterium necrophorum subsp. funduliforme]KYM49576.1 hypothetical protein A2U06_06180 [Fusobacterium ne